MLGTGLISCILLDCVESENVRGLEVLYCTVLYCTVLYCTVLEVFLYWWHDIVRGHSSSIATIEAKIKENNEAVIRLTSQ